MLTEFGRKEPKNLVIDENGSANSRHLHLMALPFSLKGKPQPLPIPTGFMLPNGMEQPVLHVLFPAPTVERTMSGQ